jgi:DNA replication protein DnaC
MNEMPHQNTKICEKHGCPIEVHKMFGNMSYSFCPICSEEEEAIQNKEALEKAEEEKYKSLHNGIPKLYHKCDLSTIEGIEKINEWLHTSSGFMFIHGGCGCGKTHLACSIKKEYNRKGIKCDLIFSSDVFLQLRKSFNNKDDSEFDIIERLSPDPDSTSERRIIVESLEKQRRKALEQSLMIFDDVGAQKISDYVIEAWYNIINRRYMYNLKTIFTSNLSLKEISLCMSDRIASRLASGEVFKIEASDRRLNK